MVNLEKIKSVRFHKSLSELENTKSSNIIFQRINKINYFKFLCNSKKTKGGDDEDIIIIKHMPNLDDIEAGNVFDIDEIENSEELTDKEFRTACLTACHVCHKYARFFLLAELLTKFADLFIFAVVPLYHILDFNYVDIIIFLSIFVPIIVMQILCDWGKLLEKYARLYIEFKRLRNNKDEDRVDKFQDLVNSFKGSWIYSDMITDN